MMRDPMSDSTPLLELAVRQGLLSAESDRGMRCISGRTGELGWKRPIAVLVAADPADLNGDGIGDRLVSGERGLELVSGRTGERIWECPRDGIVRFLVVTSERNALAVVGDSELIAVSGRDGRLLWTTAPGGTIAWPLEVGDQDGDGGPDVALGSGEWIRFLRGRSGAELWRVRTGQARPLASADLDGDGVPETLVRTSDALHALSGRAP